MVIYAQSLVGGVGVVCVFGTPPIRIDLQAKLSLLGTRTLACLVFLLCFYFVLFGVGLVDCLHFRRIVVVFGGSPWGIPVGRSLLK